MNMKTSDRFLRFAAECEAKAKFSPSLENRGGLEVESRCGAVVVG